MFRMDLLADSHRSHPSIWHGRKRGQRSPRLCHGLARWNVFQICLGPRCNPRSWLMLLSVVLVVVMAVVEMPPLVLLLLLLLLLVVMVEFIAGVGSALLAGPSSTTSGPALRL